ncbi:hypothetical protein BGZ83_001161, partial [Gryganskiella cystojenkinii]
FYENTPGPSLSPLQSKEENGDGDHNQIYRYQASSFSSSSSCASRNKQSTPPSQIPTPTEGPSLWGMMTPVSPMEEDKRKEGYGFIMSPAEDRVDDMNESPEDRSSKRRRVRFSSMEPVDNDGQRYKKPNVQDRDHEGRQAIKDDDSNLNRRSNDHDDDDYHRRPLEHDSTHVRSSDRDRAGSHQSGNRDEDHYSKSHDRGDRHSSKYTSDRDDSRSSRSGNRGDERVQMLGDRDGGYNRSRDDDRYYRSRGRDEERNKSSDGDYECGGISKSRSRNKDRHRSSYDHDRDHYSRSDDRGQDENRTRDEDYRRSSKVLDGDTYNKPHDRDDARQPTLSQDRDYRQSLNLEDPGALFIGGLSYKTTEKTIERYFSKFGELSDFLLVRSSGVSRCYGYVVYSDAGVAASVRHKKHFLDSHWIHTRIPISERMQRQMVKVNVHGIANSITERELGEYFSQFGPIFDAYILHDHNDQVSLEIGAVCFQYLRGAEAALDCQDNLMLHGHKIGVSSANFSRV